MKNISLYLTCTYILFFFFFLRTELAVSYHGEEQTTNGAQPHKFMATSSSSRHVKRRHRYHEANNLETKQDGSNNRDNKNFSNQISMQNLTCHFFSQPLDHFSPSTNLSFQQRYCIFDGYEKKTVRNHLTSPIFFYTGNESPIDEYVNNTGLMYELAAKEHFSALIVFAEHRFEGESVPDFDTLLASNIGCFSYLTSSQALADFVSLLSFLNPNHDRPVIAFGGSYGGMLSSWLRIKYPGSVVGAIASSAPIFGLPLTMKGDITHKGEEDVLLPNDGAMDGAFHVIGNAIQKNVVGDQVEENHCFDNLLAAWPLMKFFGQFAEGRHVLDQEFKLCSPLESESDSMKLIEWAQSPWFDLAEADYPYESSYIPFALGIGDYRLPAWPLREACHGTSGLSQNMNISIVGNRHNVTFDVIYGGNDSSADASNLILHVDWDKVNVITSNAINGTDNQVVRRLMSSVKNAVAIWFNVTKNLDCFKVIPAVNAAAPKTLTIPRQSESMKKQHPDSYLCMEKLHNDTVWTSLVCNENMFLIMTYARGMGRDFFWPPSHSRDQHRYNDTISNRSNVEEDYMLLCSDPSGVYGYPDKSRVDPWSRNLDDMYGGTRIDTNSNIIFSNGLLDPWSAAGVYPPQQSLVGDEYCEMEGAAAFQYPCSMVQNITSDGSVVALILDLGAHHLDLMYSDPNDPPCARNARMIEEVYIKKWIQQWVDNITKRKRNSVEEESLIPKQTREYISIY
jgi:Serine carboxypeptidase S28.